MTDSLPISVSPMIKRVWLFMRWEKIPSVPLFVTIDNNVKLVFYYIAGLVQERRNSSALAMELRLSCTYPAICFGNFSQMFFMRDVLLYSAHSSMLDQISCSRYNGTHLISPANPLFGDLLFRRTTNARHKILCHLLVVYWKIHWHTWELFY